MKPVALLCVLLTNAVLTENWSLERVQRQSELQTTSKSTQRKREWHAATYRGLTIGKSTRADVLRVLGQPQRQDTPPDQDPNDSNQEIWYVYNTAAEIRGELTAVINKRTDVLIGIDVYPAHLSRAEIIKLFAPDYILTRYDFDEYLGNEESAPLYESANGTLLEIEYRHRGIAVSIDDHGNAQTISYVSKPIGAAKSKCKQ